MEKLEKDLKKFCELMNKMVTFDEKRKELEKSSKKLRGKPKNNRIKSFFKDKYIQPIVDHPSKNAPLGFHMILGIV